MSNESDWVDKTKDLAKEALGLSKAMVSSINHIQENGIPSADKPEAIFTDVYGMKCVRYGSELYERIKDGRNLKELGRAASSLGASVGFAWGGTDEQLVYYIGIKTGIIPHRIQRKRTKGWRKPDNAIVITRPSKFGNPFPVKDFGRRRSVELFGLWFNDGWHDDMIGYVESKITAQKRESLLSELRGKVLCCWCKQGELCHGDVYLAVL